MPDMDLLQNIHRLDQEVAETQAKIRAVSTQIKAEIMGSDTYLELERVRERAKELRDQLKAETDARMADELAELKFKLRDQKEILSHHLVQYYGQSEDDQVPLADNPSRAKHIILTAKLSKEEAYQERMEFSKNAKVSVSDGKTKTTFSKDGIKTEEVKNGKG